MEGRFGFDYFYLFCNFSFGYSLYFVKSNGYGLYEIHEQNNKFGGIVVISFSCVSVFFANLVLWLK